MKTKEKIQNLCVYLINLEARDFVSWCSSEGLHPDTERLNPDCPHIFATAWQVLKAIEEGEFFNDPF